MGRGRKSVLGFEGGKTKKLFKCQVAICSVTPRGCDVPKHYDNRTNWELLEEMRNTLFEDKLESLREKADPHTLFMFSKGFTKTRLPTWSSHIMVKDHTMVGTAEGSNSIMSRFLQVSLV